MAKKTFIQELKEKMRSVDIIEAAGLRIFFLGNAESRNKATRTKNESYAERVEKYGEKRFGKDWWK